MYKRLFLNAPRMKIRRKVLRNNTTFAEKLLWSRIRKSQIGSKFIRQYSVDNYVVDFYCPSHKLAIEIEGEVHNSKSQQVYDSYRHNHIQAFGVKLLHFTNKEVLNQVDRVLSQIKSQLSS